MRLLQFATSEDAYKGVIRAFLTNQDGLIDGRSGLRTWSSDVVIEIFDPTQTIDFSQVGFTPKRWNTFLRHYFEPSGFSTFYQRVVHGKPVQESGYSCPVSAPHTMGNCLLGLAAHSRPLRVSLHSRACVWAPTGLLDLTFASLLTQDLAKDTKSKTTPKIVWHIDQLQLNAIKSLPILSELGYIEGIVNGDYNYSPFGKLTKYEHDKLERTIHSPYKTYRRYAKKMEKLQAGERPPVFLPELPIEYKMASVSTAEGRVSLVDLATEFDYPLERLQWSARQMGMTHKTEIAETWGVEDPRVQRLISIIKHNKTLRGVGG